MSRPTLFPLSPEWEQNRFETGTEEVPMDKEVAPSVPVVPAVPVAEQQPGNLFDALASWQPSEIDVCAREQREQREQSAEVLCEEGAYVVPVPEDDLPAEREQREQPEPLQPFDSVAAVTLLSQLKTELECIRLRRGGSFLDVIAGAVTACVEACEGYVKHAKNEQTMGWCPMTLLRNGIALALRVARGETRR